MLMVAVIAKGRFQTGAAILTSFDNFTLLAAFAASAFGLAVSPAVGLSTSAYRLAYALGMGVITLAVAVTLRHLV
jgi:hypothetical protein